MKRLIKINIHKAFENQKTYFKEMYNIEKHPSGFLLCVEKEGYFKGKIDHLHCERDDVDIDLYDPEFPDSKLKEFANELNILFQFCKYTKKQLFETMYGIHNFCDIKVCKAENKKRKGNVDDIWEGVLKGYFLIFNVNCYFKEMFGMKEFREALMKKGIHEYNDYDSAEVAIHLKQFSLSSINRACKKMLLLKKFYDELMKDLNKTRLKYFKHFQTQSWD